MRQGIPPQVGIDQGGGDARLGQAAPDVQVLRPVLHHQRDDVALVQPATDRPVRHVVGGPVELFVSDCSPLEFDECAVAKTPRTLLDQVRRGVAPSRPCFQQGRQPAQGPPENLQLLRIHHAWILRNTALARRRPLRAGAGAELRSGRDALHLGVEGDGHGLDAVHQARARVPDFTGEARVAQARNHFLEDHAQLEPCQVRPETEVLADAERTVLVVEVRHALGAPHVEIHRVVTENALVVVDGVVVQDDLVALADPVAGELDVFHRGAAHQDERGVVAQDFLAGIGNLLGVIDEVLQLIGMFHEQAHAVAGDGAGGFVAGGDQHEEKPHELLVGEAGFLALAIEQRADDVVLRVVLVLLGQLHGVGDHVDRGELRLLLADGHLRILVEHHGVRPFEEILAILGRDSAQLEDRQQRQLGRHFLHEFALAAVGDRIDDAPGMGAETRLVGVDRRGGEGGAHDAPRFQLPRRIHVDGHVPMDGFQLLLRELVGERRTRLGGEQLGMLGYEIDFLAPGHQPVRNAPRRVFHVMDRAIVANALEFLVWHAVGIDIGVDEIGKRTTRHGEYSAPSLQTNGL